MYDKRKTPAYRSAQSAAMKKRWAAAKANGSLSDDTKAALTAAVDAAVNRRLAAIIGYVKDSA